MVNDNGSFQLALSEFYLFSAGLMWGMISASGGGKPRMNSPYSGGMQSLAAPSRGGSGKRFRRNGP